MKLVRKLCLVIVVCGMVVFVNVGVINYDVDFDIVIFEGMSC